MPSAEHTGILSGNLSGHRHWPGGPLACRPLHPILRLGGYQPRRVPGYQATPPPASLQIPPSTSCYRNPGMGPLPSLQCQLPLSGGHTDHVPLRDRLGDGRPPCQPFSTAGKHRGLEDPRSKALLNVARLIHYLRHTQPHGVSYIIKNVPGTDKHPEVKHMLGDPVWLDAPPLRGRRPQGNIVLLSVTKPGCAPLRLIPG